MNAEAVERTRERSPAADTRTRFDIQFLRGVSVLLVVLFHGFGDFFAKGYLGVDVFFVISGFLITSIILRDLQAGTFSFRGFYLRRAKRLLPAAYSTFIGTTLVSYLVLTAPQWSMYLLQLAGALTFSANVVLSLQVGYFADAAETKPLLHIWSLSLEEQFYFIIPLLLWILAPKLRPGAIALGAAASLALCFYAVSRPDLESFAFFLLPTRAWELLAGSACGWIVLRRGQLQIPSPVQWLGLAAILFAATVGLDSVHPRGDAMIAVAGTALILLARDRWLPQTFLSRPVALVGNWSYSLYLVHWPLFSFAYIAYLGDPPVLLLVALALLSILLGWGQYTFVELPFRYGWRAGGRRVWAWFAGMTAAVGLVAAPAGVAKVIGSRPAGFDLPPNDGLSAVCNQEGARWLDLPACRTSSTPRVAVWGDSNAMHLVSGLRDLPMIQMTRRGCSPILGIGQISAETSPGEARACMAFNESVARRIIADHDLRFVVMSSPWVQYFPDLGQQLIIGGETVDWRNAAPAYLARTIRRVRASGKTVILVAPVPRSSFDPGACYLRRAEGVPVLGRDSCDIERSELYEWYPAIVRQLRQVAAASGAELYVPEDLLCNARTCATRAGGVIIYRDRGHLTHAGSEYLMNRLGLRQRLAAER
ncbi:MAG TPA: acyltransferase family protein [Allosphingosinicella sp.]